MGSSREGKGTTDPRGGVMNPHEEATKLRMLLQNVEVLQDNKFEIISKNHKVKDAFDALIDEITEAGQRALGMDEAETDDEIEEIIEYWAIEACDT